VVGLSSDLELAGMGPATNLCDSFLYMFTFLAVVRIRFISHSCWWCFDRALGNQPFSRSTNLTQKGKRRKPADLIARPARP
jgi:hypothetical protein